MQWMDLAMHPVHYREVVLFSEALISTGNDILSKEAVFFEGPL